MVDPTSEAVKHTLYALQGRHLNERVVAHALNVALKHFTDDDLLNAPGGRALKAEGWDEALTLLWRNYDAIDAGEFNDARIANPYRTDTHND